MNKLMTRSSEKLHPHQMVRIIMRITTVHSRRTGTLCVCVCVCGKRKKRKKKKEREGEGERAIIVITQVTAW